MGAEDALTHAILEALVVGDVDVYRALTDDEEFLHHGEYVVYAARWMVSEAMLDASMPFTAAGLGLWLQARCPSLGPLLSAAGAGVDVARLVEFFLGTPSTENVGLDPLLATMAGLVIIGALGGEYRALWRAFCDTPRAQSTMLWG